MRQSLGWCGVGMVLCCAWLFGVSGGEVWASRRFAPKGTTPKYARDTPFLIKHLRLELTILPRKKYVSGHATLTITPKARTITSVTLDAAELNIHKVFADGKPTTWLTEGQRLIISLPAALSPGKQTKLRVFYDAHPRTGLHFVLPKQGSKEYPMVFSQGESEYNRFWYPGYDTPNMRFTSETLITVPKPLMVIANGKLLKKLDKGKWTTFHHKMAQSHVNYLTSIAIGKFALYRQSWDGIPILNYVPTSDLDKAARAFQNTPDMMKFFSEKTGFRYPYARYAQVVVRNFIVGGMENISATTLNDRTMRDAREQLDHQSDGLIAHELAHQWFGDLLTCKDWSHIWLNESFATYFMQLYFEHKWGKDAFDFHRTRSKGWYYFTPYKRRIQERVYWHPSSVFDAHAYPKGAAVLHMIRRRLGDRLWWKAIQTYVKRHAYGLVETADLRRAIESVSDLNWERFFDQWLRTPGHPVMRFSWRYLPQKKQVELTFRQTQKGHVFWFDTVVRITDAKGSKRLPVSISKRRESLLLSVVRRPKMVEFDPDGDILMQLKAKKSPQQWRYQLLHGASVASRMRAARGLKGAVNRPKVLAALKQVLWDAKVHYGVRREVARTLGKMATPGACKLLMEGAMVKESRVRSVVVRQLGGCEESKPLPLLITRLRLDESYEVRAAAVASIAKLRHRLRFPLLVEALGQPFGKGVIQSAALWAMVRLEDPRAIRYAREAMDPSNHRNVRLTGIQVYAKLLAHFKKRRRRTDIKRIAAFLRSNDAWMRGTAVAALGTLGDWRALPILRRYAAQAPVPTIKKRVRAAIQKIYKQTSRNQRLKRFGQSLEALKRAQQKLRQRLEQLERLHRVRSVYHEQKK